MKIIIILFILLVYFATNSTFAQPETNIKRSELPDQVNTELNAKYVKYIVNQIIKKENQTKETIYEIEVQKKNTVYTLVYNNILSYYFEQNNPTQKVSGLNPNPKGLSVKVSNILPSKIFPRTKYPLKSSW